MRVPDLRGKGSFYAIVKENEVLITFSDVPLALVPYRMF